MDTIPVKTIMDVGMHRGEDTRYYLEKGFRVVAIEARGDFVEENRQKFQAQIERGALEIVHAAIAETEGTIPFYVFPEVSVWGTADPRYLERNETGGIASKEIAVPATRFESILERYGVPYYLKVDIEGFDLLCLKALGNFAERPRYVSVELTMTDFNSAFESLACLFVLGYRRFKLVNQPMNVKRSDPKPPREGAYVGRNFEHGMSGLFGRDLPGKWLDAERAVGAIRARLGLQDFFSRSVLHRFAGRTYGAIARRVGGDPLGWWDLHASAEQ